MKLDCRLFYLIAFVTIFGVTWMIRDVAAQEAYVDCWRGQSVAYNCDLSVNPTLPTVNHNVQVSFSGAWSDGCLPQFEGMSVTGQMIALRLSHEIPPDIGCTAAIEPFTFGDSLGRLTPGTYQLTSYINDEVAMSTTFEVLPTRTDLYFPLVRRAD